MAEPPVTNIDWEASEYRRNRKTIAPAFKYLQENASRLNIPWGDDFYFWVGENLPRIMEEHKRYREALDEIICPAATWRKRGGPDMTGVSGFFDNPKRLQDIARQALEDK